MSMSIERLKQATSPEKKQDTEKVLEELLARLPTELQDHWSDAIDALPLGEQIQKITAVLEKRSEKKNLYHSAHLLPDGIEMFESFPEDVRESIDTLRNSERTIEVGYGKAGHVIAHPSQPLGTNDIARETEFQHEVCEQFDGSHGVRVPKVFAFISEPGTRAITMELLNAPSLRKVVKRKTEKMPENFDEEKFFSALEAFIKAMHERGYYHRDLHAGNVLVHRETGMPCVIDFGLSKKVAPEEGDPYREQVVENGHFVEIVLQSDTVNFQKLRQQVSDYLVSIKE